MDAIELLIKDHDEVRSLFERFRAAHEQGETETMGEIAAKVVHELEVHTALEEDIFYPALREADDELDEEVAEGIEEHHVAQVLMNEMRDLDPGDEAWAAKMTVLMENVEHHVEEEEGDLFPDARKAMEQSQLEELGQQMVERRESAQSEPASRAELYERAKQLEIEGRSKMDKDELARAVAEADR